jgi:hypothetical protein
LIDCALDLKRAVEAHHGCTAALIQSVPVTERRGNAIVWEGVVHVFQIHGHPKATVLHLPPATSPAEAVRAAIVAEQRK